MKYAIVPFALMLMALVGCTGKEQAPPKTAETPQDSIAGNAPPLGGNMKRVFALGHFFSGIPNTEWRLYEDHTYDDSGRVVTYVSYFDGADTKVTTQYDPQGFEILQVRKGLNTTDNLESRSTWNADHTEQVTEVFSQVESRVIRKITRKMDANGEVLSIDEKDSRLLDYPVESHLKMVRNGQGQLIEERELVEGKEFVGTKYKYDAQGHLIEVKRMDNEGKPSQTETFEYDAEGRKSLRYLQEHTAYISTRQLAGRWEYDGNGRLARVVTYRGECDLEKEKIGKCVVGESITYTYDSDGRMATETIEQQYPSPKTMRKRFEYAGKVPLK